MRSKRHTLKKFRHNHQRRRKHKAAASGPTQPHFFAHGWKSGELLPAVDFAHVVAAQGLDAPQCGHDGGQRQAMQSHVDEKAAMGMAAMTLAMIMFMFHSLYT